MTKSELRATTLAWRTRWRESADTFDEDALPKTFVYGMTEVNVSLVKEKMGKDDVLGAYKLCVHARGRRQTVAWCRDLSGNASE